MKEFFAKKRFFTTSLTTIIIVVACFGLFFPQKTNAGPYAPPINSTGQIDTRAQKATVDYNNNLVYRPGTCIPLPGFNFSVSACVAEGVNIIMSIVAKTLAISGGILNISLDYSLNFQKVLDQVPIVDIGWKVLRDISNIVFIFIALWSGISITLGIKAEKAWGLLAQMVLVALFINFSLFITKSVVDVSNIAALHFYRLMVANPAGDSLPQTGLSDAFMNGLRLETLYNANAIGGDVNYAASVSAGEKKGNIHPWNIVVIGVFGSIFMLIATFVFFAAAIMFVIRTVTLLMLMILSPLAFVAWLLPGASGLAHEWWSKLWSQSFFAPLYMALAYVVVATIQQPAFKEYLSDASFAEALTSSAASPGWIGIVFNFILLSALLIACLLVASSLGAKGSGAMISFGKKVAGEATGFVGRSAMRSFGLGAIGERLQEKNAEKSARGESVGKFSKWGARLLKYSSVRNLNERLGQTRFGNWGVGKFLKEQTTGRLTEAKWGGSKSAEEAYEESEHDISVRHEIEQGHIAKTKAEQLREARKAGASQETQKQLTAEIAKALGKMTTEGFLNLPKTYFQMPEIMNMEVLGADKYGAMMASEHFTEEEKHVYTRARTENIHAEQIPWEESHKQWLLAWKKYEKERQEYETKKTQIEDASGLTDALEALKKAQEEFATISKNENSTPNERAEAEKKVGDARNDVINKRKSIQPQIDALPKAEMPKAPGWQNDSTRKALRNIRNTDELINLYRYDPNLFDFKLFSSTIMQGMWDRLRESDKIDSSFKERGRMSKRYYIQESSDLQLGLDPELMAQWDKVNNSAAQALRKTLNDFIKIHGEQEFIKKYFQNEELNNLIQSSSMQTDIGQGNFRNEDRTTTEERAIRRDSGKSMYSYMALNLADNEFAKMPGAYRNLDAVMRALDRSMFANFGQRDIEDKVPMVEDLIKRFIRHFQGTDTLTNENLEVLIWLINERAGKEFIPFGQLNPEFHDIFEIIKALGKQRNDPLPSHYSSKEEAIADIPAVVPNATVIENPFLRIGKLRAED